MDNASKINLSSIMLLYTSYFIIHNLTAGISTVRLGPAGDGLGGVGRQSTYTVLTPLLMPLTVRRKSGVKFGAEQSKLRDVGATATLPSSLCELIMHRVFHCGSLHD
ncbi:unnamed protein product [Pieris macdunnoughi]|uniref:Uncharacterized protein n=1 Tax=Pieris macdunnoughi TaxID=345717 RepID=A0A821VWY3_9NEOP|nr:unnamed protein product [Pieris macdunnoughi]